MAISLNIRWGELPKRLNQPWIKWTAGILGGLAFCGFIFVMTFYWSWQSSRRADEVRVPDVKGLALNEAQSLLEQSDLVYELESERPDLEVPSGHILEQTPVAGASVRPGRTIRLVSSMGAVVLSVPDLVGKADRALQVELKGDGFRLGDQAYVHNERVAEGRVLAQWPPKDRPAVSNESLHRLISLGDRPRQFVMPDLRRRPQAVVEEWIRVSGLRVGAVRQREGTGEPSGTVLGHSPLPGHPVRPKEAIQLTVAR